MAKAMKKQSGAGKQKGRELPGNGSNVSEKRSAEEIFKRLPAIIIGIAEIPGSQEQVFNAFKHRVPWKWQGSDESYSQIGWAAELMPGGKWKIDLRLIDNVLNAGNNEFLEIDDPRKLTMRYGLDLAPSMDCRVGGRSLIVLKRPDLEPASLCGMRGILLAVNLRLRSPNFGTWPCDGLANFFRGSKIRSS